MSAYIVSPEKVARLAIFGATSNYLRSRLDITKAKDIARRLMEENVRSIESRYPDVKGKAMLDFMDISEDEYLVEVDAVIDDPHEMYVRFRELNHQLVAIDLLEYDYQACECSDYRDSRAFSHVHDIAMRIARRVNRKICE